MLTPQQAAPRQYTPQGQADDGYIYSTDGNDVTRYPAPPGSRRLYGSQAYQQPQQYYGNRDYRSQDEPQVYAPRPYQPRGFFGYQQ